jgi:hypothetical protein
MLNDRALKPPVRWWLFRVLEMRGHSLQFFDSEIKKPEPEVLHKIQLTAQKLVSLVCTNKGNG